MGRLLYLIVLFAALFITAYGITPQLAEKAQAAKEKCKDIPSREDDSKENCNGACFMKAMDYMKDGKINLPGMIAANKQKWEDPKMIEKGIYVDSTCSEKVGEPNGRNECELAFDFVTCKKQLVKETYSKLYSKSDGSCCKGLVNDSSNESMKSCSIEKVRDSRILDLEGKLAVAEDRCTVLRKQVAYMKMLYTSSHQQPGIGSEDSNNKITGNLQNTVGNPMCYKAEVDNYNNAPANMGMKSMIGTALKEDPKEAMQLIVNEMTQSVNAMEGSVNIHSNTIEGVCLKSRNKRKRPFKKDDLQLQRVKKNTSKQITKMSNDQLIDKKKSVKSLGSRSKSGSNVHGKKRQARSTVAEVKNQVNEVKESEVKMKDQIKKRDKVVKVSKTPEEGSRNMAKISSSTYLLPTLSYRMKCVPKSYRPQFSFHRIPFVLGKSTNKSHNIGAKIQETLSLIKLSRKGLSSASGNVKKEELTNILQPNSAAEPPSQPMVEDSGSSRFPGSNQNKQRGPMTVGASTDYKNYQLRTVLMNLHDEFSKMTENYESMKATLKEKYDPEVAQQAQTLEDELNAKEIEINAFMNLYNEVSQLKDKLSSTRVWPQQSVMYRPTSSSIMEISSSLKMTRLLRRIEQFQDQLKNMSHI